MFLQLSLPLLGDWVGLGSIKGGEQQHNTIIKKFNTDSGSSNLAVELIIVKGALAPPTSPLTHILGPLSRQLTLCRPPSLTLCIVKVCSLLPSEVLCSASL